MIENWWQIILEFFTPEKVRNVTEIVLIVILGIGGVRLFAGLISRILKRRTSEQTAMIVRKFVFYTGVFVVILAILQRLGLRLGALLGAAGVVGIAIGFAAQTSLSNLISGLFLIYEKPFKVGDLINMGSTTGLVQSVDLLSVKVRTHANLFIRIPNSKLIDTELTNITYYPIRRLDINVSVAYKEDPVKVMALLYDIARESPLVLDEPEPLLLFQNMGDSALEILFAVWFTKTEFVAVKNSMMTTIKNRFAEEGIEIPFPHRSLYAGEATAPFPIRIVDSNSTTEND